MNDKLFIIFSIFCIVHIRCQKEMDETANFICLTILNNKTFTYDKVFEETIVKNIAEQDFKYLLNEVMQAMGKCKDFNLNQGGTYNFTSNEGDVVIINFSINKKFLIDSFVIKNVILNSMRILNFVDAMNYASYFVDGVISLSIIVRNGTSKSFQNSYNHPIGSGFKLYVLGALIRQIQEGILNWNETRELNSEFYSLPSGILQTWKNGSEIKLYDLASYMINISDNTASDHLVNFIKRDEIEKQYELMKNSLVNDNTPFIKTSEMFKLKWALNESQVKDYIKMKTIEKRIFLANELINTPLNSVKVKYKPYLIQEIEWFASNEDLCQAMFYILDQDSTEAMNILSQNVPFINRQKYDYAGFKGGSEPGVFTFTYLLKNKISQKWGCLSFAYYDTKNPLNQWITYNYLQKVISFIDPIFDSSYFVKFYNHLLIIIIIILL